ncbi:hypothetical protein LZ31DRAFT_266056 [Colletotrichum somersetense]|nr:hypothetical protein LZ31DRAFT_266056 [Colletotrichum somersetense]
MHRPEQAHSNHLCPAPGPCRCLNERKSTWLFPTFLLSFLTVKRASTSEPSRPQGPGGPQRVPASTVWSNRPRYQDLAVAGCRCHWLLRPLDETADTCLNRVLPGTRGKGKILDTSCTSCRLPSRPDRVLPGIFPGSASSSAKN